MTTCSRIITCKECKHRPLYNDDKEGPEIIPPEDKDGWTNDTCPFLCGDTWYSKMPPDNFYCAYGELEKS